MVPALSAAVSVRQHEVRLSRRRRRPDAGNAVQGTVVRNVFLGNSPRLYRRDQPDGTQLRITAAPGREPRARRGGVAALPPDRCRALVG